MKLVESSIAMSELKNMSNRMFGGLIKAVIDIEREIMVVDAAMHADEEQYLLEHGSKQDNLWGINLYPDLNGEDFIEFDSMINLRPRLQNMSREVENKETRKKIISIVHKLIKNG